MFRAIVTKQFTARFEGLNFSKKGWTKSRLTDSVRQHKAALNHKRSLSHRFRGFGGPDYKRAADMPGRHQVMTRPNHSEHVLLQLNNQREWGFLCDCSVAVGDVDFRAHKAVLAACSSYFRMMFIKDQRARLDLSNMPVSAECFDLVLQLMYLGRTVTEPSDFEELKVAMAYLQMYYIPDTLEELRGNQSANANANASANFPPPPSASSSSASCSSSSSSSPSLGTAEPKMMFGVRLYEQPRRSSAESERLLQHALAPAASVLLSPAPVPQGVARPPAEEPPMAAPLVPRPTPADGVAERPCDLRKRNSGRRAPARERPRFGRTFTCDDCGFVFSCEKLLVEHGLTCTNRKPYQSPEAQTRAHGTPSWAEASAFESAEGSEWREGDDWRERGPETPIRSVGTATDSGPTRNGIMIKAELEEVSAMDGVSTVRVGESGEDGGPMSPKYKDEKADLCQSSQGREDLDVSGVADGGGFEGLGAVEIKSEEQGSECELCGALLSDEDRTAHYISSHLSHICACGRCGQIFVRGRQLQEHAERCGEPRDSASAGSPRVTDGQGWGWCSGEEGGVAGVSCALCGLPQENEEAAARHALICAERSADSGGGGRGYRSRHGAASRRKGMYQHGDPQESRYSRRLLRDRHLRPRSSFGRDAPRHCSPAASAAGTPSSGTTTCAT
ncbi:hypothetical protein GJAV_G00108300 [Gymnothorax javanicus]|nr:hypothetical protein GJAV_G00108300 [Gymnothorax javanicus]